MKRSTPLLHRDDPDREPLVGHIKVTKEDWLNVAKDILINDGVGEVKILAISERLEVSRSSFYWYFKSRDDLLSALLNDWATRNTSTIVEYCERHAETIAEALCNFFRCFVDPELFDQGLDFAVREWSRRDAAIRGRIDTADRQRLDAVTKMFARFGYSDDEADIRGRILYFMQLGYHALEVREPMAERMRRVPGYLEGFTGVTPAAAEYQPFLDFALKVDQGQS